MMTWEQLSKKQQTFLKSLCIQDSKVFHMPPPAILKELENAGLIASYPIDEFSWGIKITDQGENLVNATVVLAQAPVADETNVADRKIVSTWKETYHHWPFKIQQEFTQLASGYVETKLFVTVIDGMIMSSMLPGNERIKAALEQFAEVISVEAFNEHYK